MSSEVVDSLCFESASALVHYEKDVTRALLYCSFCTFSILATFKPFAATEQVSVEIFGSLCFISAAALLHCSLTDLKFCK